MKYSKTRSTSEVEICIQRKFYTIALLMQPLFAVTTLFGIAIHSCLPNNK